MLCVQLPLHVFRFVVHVICVVLFSFAMFIKVIVLVACVDLCCVGSICYIGLVASVILQL